MSDMDAVTAAKSDQFNADDLHGSELLVTVDAVQIRAGTEQPITVKLKGQTKVFRPCKTVARIMKAAWGPDSAVYPGRSMLLFTDPDVTWGGMKVGGIRVRAISHISDALVIALQEKKGSKKITTVRPLVVDAVNEGLTVQDAEQRLRSAATLEELRAAWIKRDMEPHRERLQSVLDERKAALTPAATDADEIIAAYTNATTPDEITAADKAAAVLGLDDVDVTAARVEAVGRVGEVG